MAAAHKHRGLVVQIPQKPAMKVPPKFVPGVVEPVSVKTIFDIEFDLYGPSENEPDCTDEDLFESVHHRVAVINVDNVDDAIAVGRKHLVGSSFALPGDANIVVRRAVTTSARRGNSIEQGTTILLTR